MLALCELPVITIQDDAGMHKRRACIASIQRKCVWKKYYRHLNVSVVVHSVMVQGPPQKEAHGSDNDESKSRVHFV